MLYALAYNLGNLLRRVTAQATRKAWSLRRMREQLLRAPARMLQHARRVTVVLRRLARLRPLPPPVCG